MANIGNPAGLIAAAIRAGTSATKALGEFRGAGGSIRTQSWYRAFGEVRAAIGRHEAISGLDPSLPPDPGMFSQWSAGRPGTFAYQVDVLVRDKGSGVVYRTAYTYLTDQLVPLQSAIDEAIATYTAGAETSGSWDGQQIIGAVPAGLYEMVGRH